MGDLEFRDETWAIQLLRKVMRWQEAANIKPSGFRLPESIEFDNIRDLFMSNTNTDRYFNTPPVVIGAITNFKN